MPLNACGWTNEEDEILAELVRPHSLLYSSANDPSRKNILAREAAWCQISESFVNKPPQECKKHWKSLKSSYVRSRKLGAAVHKTKVGLYAKLDEFMVELEMDSSSEDYNDELVYEPEVTLVEDEGLINGEEIEGNNQMDTGNIFQTVTMVDSAELMNTPRTDQKVFKVLVKAPQQTAEIKAPVKRGRPRRKIISVSHETIPTKKLPQPIILNSFQYQGQQNIAGTSAHTQLIDTIMEKILKESTNEVDVFFKSMAEAVKKMDPGLVPKVKMEVCNVVAKYEMQSIYKKY